MQRHLVDQRLEDVVTVDHRRRQSRRGIGADIGLGPIEPVGLVVHHPVAHRITEPGDDVDGAGEIAAESFSTHLAEPFRVPGERVISSQVRPKEVGQVGGGD